MGDGLKQRIAGTIVLTTLGLILLPLMIDFADPDKIDRNSKIPPPPSLEIENIVKAKKPEQVDSKNNLKSLFDPCFGRFWFDAGSKLDSKSINNQSKEQ